MTNRKINLNCIFQTRNFPREHHTIFSQRSFQSSFFPLLLSSRLIYSINIHVVVFLYMLVLKLILASTLCSHALDKRLKCIFSNRLLECLYVMRTAELSLNNFANIYAFKPKYLIFPKCTYKKKNVSFYV